MPSDPDLLRKNLRIDTCRLLKYDINALTAAQEVRLTRATMLRLELDDIETRKINNQSFDAAKYILISEALERLVGGNPDQQTAAGQHDFAGAREELLHFLENRAAALERRDERIKADALEANKQTGTAGTIVAPPPQQPPSPVPELLPEGQDPPTSNVHHSYVDHDVIESDADRYQRINGGTVTPASRRPPSAATAAYFGNAPGGSLNCGGSPWRTRDWNPRRGF
jgi:hypothetical protein